MNVDDGRGAVSAHLTQVSGVALGQTQTGFGRHDVLHQRFLPVGDAKRRERDEMRTVNKETETMFLPGAREVGLESLSDHESKVSVLLAHLLQQSAQEVQGG